MEWKKNILIGFILSLGGLIYLIIFFNGWIQKTFMPRVKHLTH